MNEVHGFVGNSKEKETKNNDNSKNHKKKFLSFPFHFKSKECFMNIRFFLSLCHQFAFSLQPF